MKLHSIAPAFFLIIAILVVSPVQAALQADQIRIGSWNIEHLGFPASRAFQGHDLAQSAEDLAEHILKANVDILALQEIGDTDGIHGIRRNRTLDVVFEILSEETGHDWAYRLFGNRDINDTTQLCGIAWNKEKVTRQGRPLRVPVVDNTPSEFFEWDRHPHAVKFATRDGTSDFVIIPLHMKAGNGTDEREQRGHEAQALLAALSSVRQHFNDQDIILIGDTNIGSQTEQALQQFTGSNFRDLLPSNTSTVTFGPRAFDRAFVPTDQHEFDNSQQSVLSVQGTDALLEHRTLLSDHFLIVMTIMIDDD